MHARACACDFLDIIDAFRRLQQGMDHDGLLDAVLGFELSEKLIQIMNIPSPLDLRHHDDIELAADRRHDFEDVVENPRTVERVDARPKTCAAEVVRARHLDETAPRRFLVLRRDRVFEISANHVHLLHQLGDLGADLLDLRRHEMDHALKTHGLFDKRSRSARCESLEELRGCSCLRHRSLSLRQLTGNPAKLSRTRSRRAPRSAQWPMPARIASGFCS